MAQAFHDIRQVTWNHKQATRAQLFGNSLFYKANTY